MSPEQRRMEALHASSEAWRTKLRTQFRTGNRLPIVESGIGHTVIPAMHGSPATVWRLESRALYREMETIVSAVSLARRDRTDLFSTEPAAPTEVWTRLEISQTTATRALVSAFSASQRSFAAELPAARIHPNVRLVATASRPLNIPAILKGRVTREELDACNAAVDNIRAWCDDMPESDRHELTRLREGVRKNRNDLDAFLTRVFSDGDDLEAHCFVFGEAGAVPLDARPRTDLLGSQIRALDRCRKEFVEHWRVQLHSSRFLHRSALLWKFEHCLRAGLRMFGVFLMPSGHPIRAQMSAVLRPTWARSSFSPTYVEFLPARFGISASQTSTSGNLRQQLLDRLVEADALFKFDPRRAGAICSIDLSDVRTFGKILF